MPVTFAARLAEAMEDKNFTDEQLAQLVGKSRRAISNLRRGESNPYEDLAKLAVALDKSTDWLISGSGGGVPEYERGSGQNVRNVPIFDILNIVNGLGSDPAAYRKHLSKFYKNPHGHKVIPISYNRTGSEMGIPNFCTQALVDWFSPELPINSMIGWSTEVVPAVQTFSLFAVKEKQSDEWFHASGYFFPRNYRAIPAISYESYKRSWKRGFILCGNRDGTPSIYDVVVDPKESEFEHLATMTWFAHWRSDSLANDHWDSMDNRKVLWKSRKKPQKKKKLSDH